MPPFLVCVHDATPAYARETRLIVRELAALVGRRFSCGVVPNWHGHWPLTKHPEYCRLIRDGAEELLLHGCSHRRQRGWGPITWLAERSDEMNGLDLEETRRSIEYGQRIFSEAFGERARAFLPPAWQRGRIRPRDARLFDLEHVMGFFSVASRGGRSIPLATSTWDCGRWRWLGHVGHAIGRLSQALDRGVPTLAIHPRDITRGFWPKIRELTETLLDAGYEPSTIERLLEARDVEIAA